MMAMYTMQTAINRGHVSISVHNHGHRDTQMTPNWQHHSKKEAKRKLRPRAMQSRKQSLKQFKQKYGIAGTTKV